MLFNGCKVLVALSFMLTEVGGIGMIRPFRYLVTQGCIKPLCDLLTCNDPRLVTVALEGIENVSCDPMRPYVCTLIL